MESSACSGAPPSVRFLEPRVLTTPNSCQARSPPYERLPSGAWAPSAGSWSGPSSERAGSPSTRKGCIDRSPSLSVRQAYLKLIVVEHPTVSHVGLALRRGLIRVGAVRRELPPPDGRRPYDSLANAVLHARESGKHTAVVVNRDSHSDADASPFRVRRMKDAFRLFHRTPQRIHVHERGVQELVRRRRDERQRKARDEGCVALR